MHRCSKSEPGKGTISPGCNAPPRRVRLASQSVGVLSKSGRDQRSSKGGQHNVRRLPSYSFDLPANQTVAMLLRCEGSSSVVTVEKDAEVLVTVENDDGGEPNTILLSFEDGDSDDPRVRQAILAPDIGC